MKFKTPKPKHIALYIALTSLASLDSCRLPDKDGAFSPDWEVKTVPTNDPSRASAKLESVEEAPLPGSQNNLLELIDPVTGKLTARDNGTSIPNSSMPLSSTSVVLPPEPWQSDLRSDPISAGEAGPAGDPPMPDISAPEPLDGSLLASDTDFDAAPRALPRAESSLAPSNGAPGESPALPRPLITNSDSPALLETSLEETTGIRASEEDLAFTDPPLPTRIPTDPSTLATEPSTSASPAAPGEIRAGQPIQPNIDSAAPATINPFDSKQLMELANKLRALNAAKK